MGKTVISVENLSKSYRLGQIGTGTLTNDLKVWAAKVRGKPNPLLRIGQIDHGNHAGELLWALKDINFTAEKGEVLGIIGRNGAGKSTLLKILSRVTAPSSGCVKVKGRIASLLEVGTGFHPELTGRENIYLNGAILGMTKQEVTRKFDEIVAFADIEKFIDTPVKRYSSGMYVRLAFAVAAHLESEILLVDEVLAVGDAEFQKKCLGKMGDVASREGRTVLFVSHNMSSISTLCSRSILLAKGTIKEDGLTGDVINGYLRTTKINSSQNLEIRTDRRGKGDVRLKDFFVSIDGIHKADFLMTGRPAFFIFRIDPPQRGVYCRFTIFDSNRNAIAHFNSSVNGYGDDITSSDRALFICKIKDFFLTPGKFDVNVLISTNIDIQDHIENALTFIVEAGVQGGRQMTSAGGYGIVSIPHHWIVSDGIKEE